MGHSQIKYVSADYCLCRIPVEHLERWARLHYEEKRPTQELLRIAKDENERKEIRAIALLKVDDEVLMKMLDRHDGRYVELMHYIYGCRVKVKRHLKLT